MAYTEDVNVNLNVLTGTMSGITAIMGGMSALTSSFGAMGTAAADSFGALDGLLVSATALITTFAIQSAEAFGQYEQGMKIVQTVSGQTSYAMQELSTQANQMAINYRTSINDITDGLQTLGRAGLNSVNEQLEVLESGLQTAKLEGRNLNGVLEELIQNTAMLGGDLKSVDFGEQTAYLNTIMVGTSMTAPITSHDISQTLQYAGGTAAAAGANLENKDKLEDLMGTIAAFAQKGVKGSMSGTALRAFFTKPASQDKSVTDALGSIGLSPEDLWEKGGESMKKVSDQVGIIKNRMDALKLSTMDQVELWGKIVGPKMGQQMMKLDSSSIKDLTRDIESASSAEELATQTLHTYTQKLSEMSEQGQLAYREFGEKAAMFLTPVVDVITKILGLFSHPVINFAAFATVGSLLAHGFQRAWTMITTVFGQIRNLITETGAAIENINALASGSAPGFTQSASSVEMLNSRLAQTNIELAQMQAQFMKIQMVSKTGSYVVPLGLADKNGKLPANMISTDMQKILRGANGRYYDQSDTKAFTKDYKQYLIDQNQKEINKAVESHKSVDSTGRSHYHMIPGGKGQFMSKDALTQYYQKEMGLSAEEINKKTTDALKSSQGQVHSSLMSMTEKEYKKWYKGLESAEKHINTDANYKEGGRYIKDNGKFNQALYNRDQLRMFNKQYQDELVRNSGGLHTNTVNGVKFYRGLHLAEEQQRFYGTDRIMQKQAQLEEYEKTRASKLKPQATTMNDRALQVTKGRLDAYSNAISKATTSVTSFGSNLKLGATKWIKGFDAVMPQFQAKAMNALQGIEIGKTSFNEGLIQLQQATGLSAKEFQQLWLSSNQLQQAFLKHYGIVMSDAEVTMEDVVSKKADASATIEDMVAKEADAASTSGGIMGKAINGLGTVVGYMGGPFMAGMMAFSAATMLWQNSVQAWSKAMSDAENSMSESKDKVSQAEDSIKELYTSENNQLSEADQDKIIDYQYAAIQESYNADMSKHGKKTDPKFGDMYNNEVIKVEELNWSKEDKEKPLQDQLKTSEDLQALNDSTEKLSLKEEENIKKLEENTVALNSATYAFAQALNKEAMAFDDPLHGYQGVMSKIEEDTGLDGVSAWLAEGPGAILANELDIKDKIWEMFGWDKGFFEYNSGVLTQYQAGDNYAGSKEMGPLLSTDMYQLGTEEGLRQFFGSDFDSLKNSVDHINQKSGATLETFKALSNNNFQGMDSTGNAMAQMLWKEDPETIQKLGKQMFRYEQQRGIDSGHSAMEDWHSGKLQHKKLGNDAAHPSANKNVYKDIAKKKYTVTDKNLKATMDKIYRMTDGKLSYANILAMGQLQMFSDMYTVANEQIYPTLSQQLIAANQNVLATGTAGTNAGAAANGAGAAANNAAVIAGMLGEKLKMEASGLAYENDYLQDPNAPKTGGILGFGEHLMSKEEFINEMSNLDNHDFDKYRQNRWSSLAQVTGGLGHPEWGPEERKAYGERAMSKILNADGSLKDGVYKKLGIIDDTILGPGLKTLAKQIEASYDQSPVGEYGGGKNSGSGSGGGGGDGSGGSGSGSGDKGTRTNRVDLVLCNKKTIPKLNVNLFKKPPQFTIKNKQFSIRDININTQDKPNAMVDAVKDSIIRTQQRMDPKIVQDEQAVYDPAAATDGTTPKGKTSVKSK